MMVTVFLATLWAHRAKFLESLRAPRDTAPAKLLATILVYTPTTTWWAKVPEEEVLEHLGDAGLHYPPSPSRRLPFALLFGLGASIAVSVFAVQLIPVALMGLLFPFLLFGGSIAGWKAGANQETMVRREGRIWCVRSQWIAKDGEEKSGERSIEPMVYEPLQTLIETEMLEQLSGGRLHQVTDDKTAVATGGPRDARSS